MTGRYDDPNNYPDETNGIGNFYLTDEGRACLDEAAANRIDWADCRLLRLERFRMLTDAGFPFWDISYCRGIFRDDDGTERYCEVVLPFSQLTKGKWWSEVKAHAQRDGVNLSRIKLWDSVSKLW
ncbi:hypothetical protein DRQ50_00175 [bacterium]|nr:MAG: hypothetical protein DRQ50_00175 [bacterium]RKZ72442.1 MAG: hypothetical protein DRQ48_00085 [Gammaproteobacteria bacterium]